MKLNTVANVKNHFPRVLDQLTGEPLFITRNGRIVAVMQAMDEDGVEDHLLQHSEKFWKLVEQRRRRARRGRTAPFREADYAE